MKNVYFFSGLGADERVFQFLDLSFCNPVFIKWDLPLNKESIEDYAIRLTSQILHENPVLVGVSFGGMMAVEVAKLIKAEKLILISSAKTRNEIPSYYQIAGKINAHKVVPASILKQLKIINYFLFGVESIKEKELLNSIIDDTNPEFLKWAIDKIVHWENEIIPENTVHIHGTKDKMLPFQLINSDFPVKNGGHFMIIQHSQIINTFLRFVIK